MKKMIFAVSVIAALTAPLAHAANGDAKRGESAIAMCISCHQADGSGKDNPGGESWPRLAGLNADYLAQQLKSFKDGTRVNASMAAFAGMLDDQRILDVAAYYSQLPAPAIKGRDASEAVLEHGRKIVLRGDWDRYIPACVSCHAPDAQGIGAAFPALAGQQAGYIEQQLNAWRNGSRKNDPQQLMLAVAERMDEKDIKAVSAWLSQQPAVTKGGNQ